MCVQISVVVLVVEAAVGGGDYAFLRAFRALRALRPLRVASRLEGIRIVVSAVIAAIPALGNVLLVGLLFFFIFAVGGGWASPMVAWVASWSRSLLWAQQTDCWAVYWGMLLICPWSFELFSNIPCRSWQSTCSWAPCTLA